MQSNSCSMITVKIDAGLKWANFVVQNSLLFAHHKKANQQGFIVMVAALLSSYIL